MKLRYTNILRTLVVALVALFSASCGVSEERMHTLKVYNWGDYIDEDLLSEFESWYKEHTGESVQIIYQTFDINEVMLAKIENGMADFDVVCPSEYIIERMMRNELLQPILTPEFEQEINDKGINYFNCVSPYIKEQFSLLEAPEGQDPNDYSVGYMWGTTGILYNTKYVTEEEAMSWNLMFDKRLQDKIFVKDAFRDVYSPILVYAKTLEARQNGTLGEDEMLDIETIRELMYDSSDESIALVESYLKRMKELVAGWEADFGKEMMTQEKGWINLMWSGDAVWAIEEAAEVDVELDYTVPVEGSVVWFDGWVIPKYAVNTRAARYFIDFMCMPENAIRNMDATGYVSVVTNEEVLEYISSEEDYDEAIDLSYLFVHADGTPIEGADSVFADPVLYPCRSVIDRCAVMHDSGDRTDKMLEMWSRVKGDNLSTGMLVGIILFFSVMFVWGIARKVNNYRKRQKHLKRRHHRAQTERRGK
ncbi:MAG: ABC transporter substrate-binding protein [Alistipes sp.]|nr:ABC transporter substrate-binding protein [Alistipes sp.]